MGTNALGSSGLPTTPVPRKPAPSPMYNDLTRPRSMRMADGSAKNTSATNTAGGNRFWDISGLDAASPQPSTTETGHVSDAGFPPPWQGCIALPEGDGEAVNAAQTWVAQILHESYDESNGGTSFSGDELADGRVLCRVANAIAWGSVETIHQDESITSQVRNMRSFLIACRKFGVPAGALFGVDGRDSEGVALCLHVLSRVVRDTVPDFAGPFIVQSRCSSPRSPGDNSVSSDEDETGEEHAGRCVDSYPHQEPRRCPDATSLASSDDKGSAQTGGLRDIVGQQRQEQQQEEPSRTVEWQPASSASHPRCPPPLQAAPDSSQQTLSWSCYPSPASEAFEAATGQSEDNPPTSRQSPLKVPFRLSGTTPAGDAGWGDVLPVREGVGGSRGGGRGGGGGSAWAPAATGNAAATAPRQKEGQAESQDRQDSMWQDVTSVEPATTAASLSSWLSVLNLSTFEVALTNIGVEAMGDLRYVEEEDLGTIGMHGPQIRKFLQNRP